MGKVLDSLPGIALKAVGAQFYDAVLIRSVPGVGGTTIEPAAPTEQSYTCKAIDVAYGTKLIGDNLVSNTNVNVLVLAASLDIAPQPLDRIRVRGQTYAVVPGGTAGLAPVTSDPARATWSLRCNN